jgi:exoribonuclease R
MQKSAFALPARKRRALKRGDSHKGHFQNAPFPEAKLSKALIRGENNLNKLASAIAADKKLPAHVRQQRIRESNEVINQSISEIRTILVNKSLEIIKGIQPDQIHPNSRPLASAILLDKALKLHEFTNGLSEAQETPQQQLMRFIKEHGVSFAQLREMVQTSKLPDNFPPELFRQLQSILHQTAPKTIDMPQRS